MFFGSLTALVTPFRDGAIDLPAFDLLVERQVAAGSHGLVVCGTTGESPTLTHAEHDAIVRRAVTLVKGRIPVIAGTGSNATAKTVDRTREAHRSGVDAVLIVTPYYNKPTQDGLYAHYRAIAEAVPVPIFLYNIPGRCVVNLEVETVARLSEMPNIVGIKDATPDLGRVRQIASRAGDKFCQLSGEDGTAHAYLEQGGHGCIGVTANITPELCAQMHDAWRQGEYAEAARLRDVLAPLNAALFAETNPAPAKYGLHRLGLCADELRLPLLPAGAMARDAMDKAMDDLYPAAQTQRKVS